MLKRIIYGGSVTGGVVDLLWHPWLPQIYTVPTVIQIVKRQMFVNCTFPSDWPIHWLIFDTIYQHNFYDNYCVISFNVSCVGYDTLQCYCKVVDYTLQQQHSKTYERYHILKLLQPRFMPYLQFEYKSTSLI
jgi:hypothetical protein